MIKRYAPSLLLMTALAAVWFMPEVMTWFNRKDDAAWARVNQTGVIRFAINPTYLPFDGLGSHGDFFGIDAEIATELARRLGKRAEFVIAGSDSLYDVLRVGQADATISALPIDPAKLGLWAYSDPYFEAGTVMIKPVGFLETQPVSSIAVEYGSEADAAARHLARRRAGMDIKSTPAAAEALQAVVNGWAEAAIVDGVSARQLLLRAPNLHIVSQVTHDPYVIAVWGESTELLRALNSTLAQLKHEGTIQRIVDNWMAK